MRKCLAVCLFLIPVSIFARGGQFNTGNNLKSDCFRENGTFNSGFCMGYIIGVADNNSYKICAPGGQGGVTQGQFRDIVKKYLNDNPAQLHRDADILVLNALQQAFPCPENK
jgi:hypothetical protein